MSRIIVNINPEVLRWAREEGRYSQEEMAEKLEVEIGRYQQWEQVGKEIPFSKLDTLSNTLKRQVAFFFLPQPPQSISQPKDYRNRSGSDQSISKEVAFAIRQAHYFKQTAIDLREEAFWEKAYAWEHELEAWQDNVRHDMPQMVAWLREVFEIDMDTQLRWKTESDAYKNWRKAVEEKLGILVFQFSMPMEEVQGFCLTDVRPYAIVVNSKQSYTGRIFTIFHELAHILRRQSGLCMIDYTVSKQQQPEEWECNRFAGMFLAPVTSLVPTDNLEEIQTYARKLKISREAYLRRLKEEGFIQDTQFFVLLDEIKKTYLPKSSAKSGIVTPERKSLSTRGETFFNLILDALQANQISYSQASGVLDLRINKIVSIL